MLHTDLSRYQNEAFQRGASRWKELLWLLCSAVLFRHSLTMLNSLKVQALKVFGAKVGTGVVIKPSVTIKFPWKLTIGDHVWIGEKVWIDNLDQVTIGNHCCLSQGAMLLCGNHNYKKVTFDLITAPITLEDGVWIGAQSLVCPGVKCGSHSVLAVKSVATSDLKAFTIYQGNPAIAKKNRVIKTV